MLPDVLASCLSPTVAIERTRPVLFSGQAVNFVVIASSNEVADFVANMLSSHPQIEVDKAMMYSDQGSVEGKIQELFDVRMSDREHEMTYDVV